MMYDILIILKKISLVKTFFNICHLRNESPRSSKATWHLFLFKIKQFADNVTFCILFFIPWFLTYLLIVFSLPNLLTVFTKNPSNHNSPPHSCFFTSEYFSNIFLAVIFFIILIMSVTLYFRTDCIIKCTWSLSVPISKKLISYLLEISRHIFLRAYLLFY